MFFYFIECKDLMSAMSCPSCKKSYHIIRKLSSLYDMKIAVRHDITDGID